MSDGVMVLMSEMMMMRVFVMVMGKMLMKLMGNLDGDGDGFRFYRV